MDLPQKVLTKSDLVAELRSGGVSEGDTLCVHTALSQLGIVIGGARTIIEALLQAVGPDGTIMMPTYSGDLSDPAEWRLPPVAPEDWARIREETPPFDPALTPTRRMGAVPEYFRGYPGVLRSAHPQSSFSAIGRHSVYLTSSHPLSFRFGPDSPLGRFAAVEGKVLMLGAPLKTSSFYYLAFYPADGLPRLQKSAPVAIDGKVRWADYEDIAYNSIWFPGCTEKLIEKNLAKRFTVGASTTVLIDAARALPQIREYYLAHYR